MPDRAVVECSQCDGERVVTIPTGRYAGMDKECPACNGRGYLPAPRALVALSEDRQWYTVLAKEPSRYDGKRYFTLFQWSDFMGDYQWRKMIEDTGQDAHAVLAAWLERRGA